MSKLHRMEIEAADDSEVLRLFQNTQTQVGSDSFLRSFNRLDELVHNLTKNQASKSKIKRPDISLKEALVFMIEQGRMAKVIWGKDEIDVLRQQLAKEGLDTTRIVNELKTRTINTDNESAENEEDNNATPEELAQAMWIIRSAMASRSATIPDFADSCKALSLSPDNLAVVNKIGKLSPILKYLPHQICSKYFTGWHSNPSGSQARRIPLFLFSDNEKFTNV